MEQNTFSQYQLHFEKVIYLRMSYTVNISVEAPIENQIQEITYDGTEIYQPYVFVKI